MDFYHTRKFSPAHFQWLPYQQKQPFFRFLFPQITSQDLEFHMSRVEQYVLFCFCLLSSHIMFLRFISVTTCIILVMWWDNLSDNTFVKFVFLFFSKEVTRKLRFTEKIFPLRRNNIASFLEKLLPIISHGNIYTSWKHPAEKVITFTAPEVLRVPEQDGGLGVGERGLKLCFEGWKFENCLTAKGMVPWVRKEVGGFHLCRYLNQSCLNV